MGKYFLNVGYSADLFVNSLFGGRRYQTISARIGLAKHNPVAEAMGDLLDACERNHVEDSAKFYEQLKAVIPHG